MRNLKLLSLLFVATLAFVSCNNNDDPEPVNEEEVITRLVATLTPQGMGTVVTLTSSDPDGDGLVPLSNDGGADGEAGHVEICAGRTGYAGKACGGRAQGRFPSSRGELPWTEICPPLCRSGEQMNGGGG